MTMLDAALAWQQGGCSVVPVRPDGTKAPALNSWRDYMTTPADTEQVARWFTTDQHQGVGIICGAASGNLEMLELEGRAITEGILLAFKQALDDHGLGDLYATLMAGYTETSPSGGIHWLYRVAGPARKNMKLARRPSTPAELAANPRNKIQVLIETRGEGGYVVVAPTPGSHHPSGKPWVAVAGSPATIPTISEEARDQLHAVAALLDTMPTAEPDPMPASPAGAPGYQAGNRPGDAYNAKADWADILGGQGWTRMWKMGAGYGWRRPGKNDRSISATTGTSADGADRLYVFSSSTDFDTETPYSKFAAYAHLEHSGDYRAAAKALAALGYGDPPTQAAPPIDIGHSSRHLRSVPSPPIDGTAALQPAPDVSTAGGSPRHSENGNALALVELHGQHIRYCPDRGRWLTWDGIRWRWEGSGGGATRELVKDVAHRMPDDPNGGSKAWRAKSLSAIGTSNTLTQASTDQRITVPIDDIDADPWALGTPTGTVDLRTGTITPPNPAQLLTRTTAVTPNPDADPAVWLQFLHTTFGEDQELIDYLQRLVGYSATGHIGPHVLPFAHGSGGNGKGVFLEALTGVLGDYATTAPNSFLMARNYSPHETEIARLAGARMVLCSEVNETDKFDEAKVKQLTGGDTLTARFMRQDHFTFTPSHHLWLMGNYRPSVTSGGRSFWRRCRLIPFLHEVPEALQVDDLQGTLIRDHGPAILAWVVQGAVDYATGGLREPASVIQATAEYAHDQDTVGRFVEEMCHRAPGQAVVKVLVRDLFGAYDRWCAETGEAPVTAKRLTQELRQRFDIEAARSNGKRFYAGISLLSDRDDDGQPGTANDDGQWYR